MSSPIPVSPPLARSLLPAVALFAPGLAFAQVPANIPRPPPPPADLIDRIGPATPPALSPRTQPPPPEAQRGPGEGREVAVSTASVQGNTALDVMAFRAVLAPIEGRTVTLARIEETRLAVLGLYRRAGYPFVSVAAALVPGPDGRAEVRFAVTEG